MNDNYMKTILSGVKEWTENLTDDAIDKANNAFDKANNAFDKANNAFDKANKSIDKALFVVNITTTDGVTYSADKTFEEIVQVYNEGKYNIVAHAASVNNLIFPLVSIMGAGAAFGGVAELAYFTLFITPNNEVYMGMLPLATLNDTLPNPHPLTFTGAVNETYDGSSAKTIEIPSGGGGGGDYTNVIRVLEEVSDYAITDIDPSEYSHFIISWSKAASGINFVSVSNGFDVGAALCTHQNGIAIILLDRSINNGLAVIRMQGNNPSAVGGSCHFISYGTSLSAGIHLTGNIPAGAVFNIRGWK